MCPIFEYLDIENVVHSGDLYIENDEELADILLYGQDELQKLNLDNFVLEIKIDKDYKSNRNSNVNYFLSQRMPATITNNYLDLIGFDEATNLDWISLDNILLFRLYK